MYENKTLICGTINYVFLSQSDAELSFVDISVEDTESVEGYKNMYAGEKNSKAHIFIDKSLVLNAKRGWYLCCRITVDEDNNLYAESSQDIVLRKTK